MGRNLDYQYIESQLDKLFEKNGYKNRLDIVYTLSRYNNKQIEKLLEDDENHKVGVFEHFKNLKTTIVDGKTRVLCPNCSKALNGCDSEMILLGKSIHCYDCNSEIIPIDYPCIPSDIEGLINFKSLKSKEKAPIHELKTGGTIESIIDSCNEINDDQNLDFMSVVITSGKNTLLIKKEELNKYTDIDLFIYITSKLLLS